MFIKKSWVRLYKDQGIFEKVSKLCYSTKSVVKQW